MKPLIRFTLGSVHECGFEILLKSLHSIANLYPECDLAVCYNNIPDAWVQQLQKTGTSLVDQKTFIKSLPLPPLPTCPPSWKLYPPRLRIGVHEIFIDNDIILHSRVPAIDQFLQSDATLMYQGLNSGTHGQYSNAIPPGFRINSGIFGIPPNFDLAARLRSKIAPWKSYFDEQGLVASTLLDNDRCLLIPLTEVPIIESRFDIRSWRKIEGVCGYHFVGANRDKHEAYLYFSSQLKFKTL